MKTKAGKFLKKTFSKIRWQEILAVLILFFAFVFFRSERKEMQGIIPQIKTAEPVWIFVGILLTFVYVLLQSLMYTASYRAVGAKISLPEAAELFLKRNLLSVFLPAGGVSALAFTPRQIQRKNFDRNIGFQASGIYGFVGIFTVFLVGIPVVGYIMATKSQFSNSWIYLLIAGILLALIVYIFFSLRNKGKMYVLAAKYFPKKLSSIDELFSGEFDRKYIIRTVIYSALIEFCGIFHVLIAMYAFRAEASFSGAAAGYTISVLLMLVSPFLRGLGAVEFSMIYILVNFGYPHSQGLGITMLYRIFEFWLPLLLGIFAFLWNGRNVILRLLPAMLIFALGIINIISVITPPLASRLKFNEIYLSDEMIHISKIITLLAGIAMLVTASNLLRGSRRAWFAAVALATVSFFGNILKAFDYEEALVSLFVVIILIISRKEYVLKSNRKYLRTGFSWFFGIFIAMLVFNFFSFYFIDKRHFGVDFTWKDSLYYTFENLLLFKNSDLTPRTGFAKDFLYINDILGIFSWSFLFFAVFSIKKVKLSDERKDFAEAENIVKQYGRSAIDFFKIAPDKQLFFSHRVEGFVSYRIANNFAVVLGEPVCAAENTAEMLSEFEKFCGKSGLRSAYYRVDEEDLFYFKPLKKKKLFIGQEAILDVEKFKLEGKERKSLRNGLNSLTKKNYKTEILTAPQSYEILDEIKNISDEWLKEFDKDEMVFSQGKFDREELENQDLIVVKNEAGEIEAFLNIIPDFAPSETTYDLIRRRTSAPNGSMDAMVVKLVEYAKMHQKKFVNLGLTPLGGMERPDNTAEEILKFVYNRLGSFKHYQSLRDFKEKYADIWENKYLVYSGDFDLLQLPAVLNKIMKP